MILVSILVPIYNVDRFLGKCLDSIFSQTYSEIEYVFVNDCSTDQSLNVLMACLDRYQIGENSYTLVLHDKNQGIAVTRADCLANAKGDYVFFVDSDDWIEPDTIEQMVKVTDGGKCDIVGCDFAKDYLSGKTTYHYENYSDLCHENMIKCINYEIATVLWKLLIRRCLFDKITIVPNLNIGEDYIISIKLFYYADSFVALHRAFYHYVQYNQSRLSFQSVRSLHDHIACLEEVEQFLHSKGLINMRIEHLIMLRKFNIKSNFLTKRLFDCSAYRKTFPEAKKIWREMGYTRNENIKFWLAEKNLYFILKLLNKCS